MKEIWKKGKQSDCIVSNVKKNLLDDNKGHNDTGYYGGYLVCESIAVQEHKDLIASAPEMKAMLKMFIGAIEGGAPDEQGCYTQRFGKAMLDEAKRIINYND
jgi:hypothetical protein